MDNIWIILLGIVGIVFSFYNRSKKAENMQKQTSSESSEPKKNIFDTILSELEGMNQNREVLSNPKQIKNYTSEEKVYNKNHIPFSKINLQHQDHKIGSFFHEEENEYMEIGKEGEENLLLNKQKQFDLREAVIFSSILYRQYN